MKQITVDTEKCHRAAHQIQGILRPVIDHLTLAETVITLNIIIAELLKLGASAVHPSALESD